MIRRSFLKFFGAAAIAFTVGVEHFRPIPAEALPSQDPKRLEIEDQISPVLQGVRDWNDERLMGKLPDEEITPGKRAEWRPTRESYKGNTIRGGDFRERWLQEMTELKKSGEFAKLADASKACACLTVHDPEHCTGMP